MGPLVKSVAFTVNMMSMRSTGTLAFIHVNGCLLTFTRLEPTLLKLLVKRPILVHLSLVVTSQSASMFARLWVYSKETKIILTSMLGELPTASNALMAGE